MTPSPLARGDLLLCPHCHRWHPLVFRNEVTSTPYANDMLFWHGDVHEWESPKPSWTATSLA